MVCGSPYPEVVDVSRSILCPAVEVSSGHPNGAWENARIGLCRPADDSSAGPIGFTFASFWLPDFSIHPLHVSVNADNVSVKRACAGENGSGMTKVRNRRAHARGGELDDCLRACAAHSGKLVGSLDLRTSVPGTDPAALTEVVALCAEQRRIRMRAPAVGGVAWIGLGEFRNRIAGKSICLIADSGRVGSSCPAGPTPGTVRTPSC
jgi:hypothetical protein